MFSDHYFLFPVIMINRLLNISVAAVLYLATSLFIAQTLLFAYLSYAWKIDKNKLTQMYAIAQGVDLAVDKEKLRKTIEDQVQQMSYDEVLRIRADRDTRVDYANARGGLTEDALLAEVRRLEDQKAQFNEVMKNFEKRAADVKEQAQTAGFNELVTMMQSLQPELAKKQIMLMLNNNEHDRVVLMLRAMEEKPRKKLLNTLQADEEVEELSDILRRVGDGEPESRTGDEVVLK